MLQMLSTELRLFWTRSVPLSTSLLGAQSFQSHSVGKPHLMRDRDDRVRGELLQLMQNTEQQLYSNSENISQRAIWGCDQPSKTRADIQCILMLLRGRADAVFGKWCVMGPQTWHKRDLQLLLEYCEHLKYISLLHYRNSSRKTLRMLRCL